MFSFLFWICYGLVIGLIAKAIYPGDNEPKGFLWTAGIGIIGSYIGGILGSLLHIGGMLGGIVMSVVGALIFCYVYLKWIEPRMKG